MPTFKVNCPTLSSDEIDEEDISDFILCAKFFSNSEQGQTWLWDIITIGFLQVES